MTLPSVLLLVTVTVLWISHWRRDYLLNLGNRYRWEVLDEQGHPHSEPTKGSNSYTNLNPREIVSTPRCWEELTCKRLEDDVKSLEPHSDVNKDRQNEEERYVHSELPEPEKLREDTVTERHSPECYPELTERTEPKLEPLKRIVAKPRGVKLSNV